MVIFEHLQQKESLRWTNLKARQKTLFLYVHIVVLTYINNNEMI